MKNTFGIISRVSMIMAGIFFGLHYNDCAYFTLGTSAITAIWENSEVKRG